MLISVVILNWKRQFVLKNLILPYISKHSLIDEIIISHGRRKSVFKYNSRHAKIIHRLDFDINITHGLSRRFIAASAARNDNILIIDDDILPFKSTITKLYQFLQNEPKIIHGLFGRTLLKDFQYQVTTLKGDIPIILTKCLMLKKHSVENCIKEQSMVDHNFLNKGTPFWNGEDIFLSLSNIKSTQTMNKAHKGFYINIPFVNGVAISKNKNHYDYRSTISQYFVKLLKIEKYIETAKMENK